MLSRGSCAYEIEGHSHDSSGVRGLAADGYNSAARIACPGEARSAIRRRGQQQNGSYRALAQLAFAASQKGDNATAAQLAKILERVWDKAEDYGGDTALSKTNKPLFDEIDKAMDAFIILLIEHPSSAPDPAKVKPAYNAYIEQLKKGD